MEGGEHKTVRMNGKRSRWSQCYIEEILAAV